MIIIHAYIKVSPNHREAFLDHAQQLMKLSKEEAGNISYHLYEDTLHPNAFVMVEEWKDQEAINIHEETTHFKLFLEVAKDMLTEPLEAKLYEATKL